MRFEAPQTTISLDGNLDDWACGPIKAQTPFYPFNKVGVGPVPPGGAAGAEGSHCCGDELTMFGVQRGETARAHRRPGDTWCP
eukprot:COSAG03_NODE_3919_length_1759_cov_3.266265_2_plen_82_part_01